MRASIQLSTISKQFQFSFTEPWFLDRPLAAGFDLYKIVTDYQQANYEGDTTAAGIRFGFPTSEYGIVGLRYTYKIDKITPFPSPHRLKCCRRSGTTRLRWSDTRSLLRYAG